MNDSSKSPVLSRGRWRAYRFFAKLVPRLLRCCDCHRIYAVTSQFKYSYMLSCDRSSGLKAMQSQTVCKKCSAKEDKRFLGKEFDRARAERVMKLAGLPTTEDLRQKGKLHPILDVYDLETNRKLGKELFEK